MPPPSGAFISRVIQLPPPPSGCSRTWARPISAPPRRMAALSAAPSGRKVPSRARSTGGERVAMPVREKPAMLSRASACGSEAPAGWAKSTEPLARPEMPRPGEKALTIERSKFCIRAWTLMPLA